MDARSAHCGCVSAWIDRVEALAKDRDALDATLASEIDKLKLSKLPVTEFLA